MFKKIGLIILAGIFCFGMDYKLTPIQISKSVYMFQGANEVVQASNGGNIANTFWIKMKDHYVVIDTGGSYLYAKQSHEAMKKIANLPIQCAINTHMHDDHWMGNSYFSELKVPIYATKEQQDNFKIGMTTRIMSILKLEDLKGTKIVPIDHIVDKNMTMAVDGQNLDFIFLTYPAHTHQDYMIYFPKEEVLFTGDLLFSERLTSIRDGSVEGSIKSLALMEKINPKVYANGHGKYTDTIALKQMKEYLTDLKKIAMEAIANGVELNEFVKTADFSKYKDFYLFNDLNKQNLDYAYREYEFFDGK